MAIKLTYSERPDALAQTVGAASHGLNPVPAALAKIPTGMLEVTMVLSTVASLLVLNLLSVTNSLMLVIPFERARCAAIVEAEHTPPLAQLISETV